MSLSFFPGRAERVSVSELVRELFQKTAELVLTQLELTKTEIKVESIKLAHAAVYGVAALMLGLVFLAFLGVSIFLAFDLMLSKVLAALVTTGILLLLTGLALGLMMVELRRNSTRIDVD
jgi:uncharacterized membrane protein YqjE